MVNLADVAHQAHVSKMTVSRVINHPEKVSTEVRTAVMAAIELIGYQPNRIAKALVIDVWTMVSNYLLLTILLIKC